MRRKPSSKTPEDFEKSFRKIFKGDFEYRAFVMIREAGLKIIHDVLASAKALPGKVVDGIREAYNRASASIDCTVSKSTKHS